MAGMNGSNIVTQNLRETTSRPTLFVLGMHRSGTSAITGALRLCGAWVGEETELTDANAENPLGFWERRDMRDLCDRMLHSAGADWWKIADFDPKAIPRVELAEQRQEFEKIISVLDKYEAWVIKEPRLCLLLPILRHYVKNPVCIHIYRNPLEVARSLQTRNRFSISAGLALWEVYNLHALNASEGLPRISLSYESIMLHPLETLDALVKELEGLATGHPIKPDRGLIERFIDKSLYHQRASDEETENYLLPSQRALWSRLRSGEVFDDHKNIPISEATRQSLLDLESVEVSLRLHKDRTGELEDSLRKYTALLKARDRRISNLEASKARLRTNLGERTATLKVRDRRIKTLEASAARLRTLEERTATLKVRDRRIKTLEASGPAEDQSGGAYRDAEGPRQEDQNPGGFDGPAENQPGGAYRDAEGPRQEDQNPGGFGGPAENQPEGPRREDQRPGGCRGPAEDEFGGAYRDAEGPRQDDR